MNQKLTVILAGIFISVFCFATIPEAQTIKKRRLERQTEKNRHRRGLHCEGRFGQAERSPERR
jgi:hypothetical protein